MKLGHLAGRFVRALVPARPKADDLAWVASILRPSELELWARFAGHDQRHSIRVAQDVERRLARTEFAGDPRWPAAALLHDVGKLDAGLGVYGRVVATLAGAAGGPGMPEAWSTRRGFTRRVGLYLRHGELGADRIRMVGGREEAAQWAAVHHRSDEWDATGIPREVVEALDAADND